MAAAFFDMPPVLIVGAGPTGLAAAMSLARARIPVRLIDKAARPDPHSRAIGIQARTLELLEQHRLIEPFLELGHRARAANLYSNGQRLARLDFDPLQTRYPYLLFLDQSVTERLLTEHLATLGVEVERGIELAMFSQGSAGINATLQRSNGHTETLHPSYMIAADGAHSSIRHRLGMNFAGKTFEQTFLLADLLGDTDWPDDEFHIFASGDGLAALFPMGNGRYRLIADHPALGPADGNAAPAAAAAAGGHGDGAHKAAETAAQASAHAAARTLSHVSPQASGNPHPASSAESLAASRPAADPACAPTLDACRTLAAARVHHPLALTDLRWSGYFHLNSRIVEQLRVGRVFLAGDAAHVHSPAGAQGMNTGIQEAFNLGWKLARVLSGGAPDRLLDTYHLERHPIEREVLRQSNFITHMAEADHGPLKLLRDRVMPVLASLGPLRDAARAQISELAIQYRRSPLTLERVLDGGPRAGERAPDALVHVVDGPLGRAPGTGCVFDLHDPAFFSLFVLVAPVDDDDVPLDKPELALRLKPVRAEQIDRLVADVEALLPGAVRTWRVTDASGDRGPLLAESYGRTRPSFYLVRPDGYVCARGRVSSDLHGLLRHCESWFAKGAVPEPPTALT
ncbi:FAD-dependent monooxygenase [Paraburkholderia rhizosphaerae]|uniref:2-polyprenyl-6-methoxyphenol hydroxylase-like FAD-dependent oxidoreductase n=1 Tax=Paraburkholderia rhizosphaerae TaxID=480658 RepID=A0A4R8LP99_9BURK|nr:FAD-dependent monooxygenase [Paraburkholderia rhizosphaerae]TDY46412.1 2-polyprenyl-6-methoxyphenol hydroxylase-like FAD-dependent oxidoreductase [Paraburkholderia rhizosphaerae]